MAAFIYLTASSMGMMLASLKKAACRHHVGTSAQTDVPGNLGGVAGVDVDAVLGDVALGVGGQQLAQLLHAHAGVDQEGTALLDVLHHLILGQVGGVVAGHEVSLLDIVGGLDLLGTEAQVADGDAAGLLESYWK